jgi:hypothetical protein
LLPAAVGLKVTLITQLDPAARKPEQLLLTKNSLAFVPLTAETTGKNASSPVFVTVTVWATDVDPAGRLANVTDAEETVPIGPTPP